jgi:hypothetical protein
LAHFLAFLFLRAKPRRRKEIYVQTALVSWLSALGSRFFLLFARKAAKAQRDLMISRLLLLVSCLFSFFARKDAESQRNLCANGSCFSALGSNLLSLFFFSLAKAQRRKEIYAKTAIVSRLLPIVSCLSALVSWFLYLFLSLAKPRRRKEIYSQTALPSWL